MQEIELEQIHQIGKQIAKTVDSLISEIECANCRETDFVYINTDNTPPEVRRMRGVDVPELWERVIEAKTTDIESQASVTVVTIANNVCTVGLAVETVDNIV